MTLTEAYFVCLTVWLIYELGSREKKGLLSAIRNFIIKEHLIRIKQCFSAQERFCFLSSLRGHLALFEYIMVVSTRDRSHRWVEARPTAEHSTACRASPTVKNCTPLKANSAEAEDP